MPSPLEPTTDRQTYHKVYLHHQSIVYANLVVSMHCAYTLAMPQNLTHQICASVRGHNLNNHVSLPWAQCSKLEGTYQLSKRMAKLRCKMIDNPSMHNCINNLESLNPWANCQAHNVRYQCIHALFSYLQRTPHINSECLGNHLANMDANQKEIMHKPSWKFSP